MTKIKLCGLSRSCDIETANELKPEYVGFVFAPKSKRYVSMEKAAVLKEKLNSEILAVGVFVNENPAIIEELLKKGIIDMVQLHGGESDEYVRQLRIITDKPIIQAFSIDKEQDVLAANECSADYVLLDSKTGGTGTVFDWTLIKKINRPYFLAGGLSAFNVGGAVNLLKPYGVDVSSGIESNGYKDKKKMAAFVLAVRKEDKNDK